MGYGQISQLVANPLPDFLITRRGLIGCMSPFVLTGSGVARVGYAAGASALIAMMLQYQWVCAVWVIPLLTSPRWFLFEDDGTLFRCSRFYTGCRGFKNFFNTFTMRVDCMLLVSRSEDLAVFSQGLSRRGSVNRRSWRSLLGGRFLRREMQL